MGGERPLVLHLSSEPANAAAMELQMDGFSATIRHIGGMVLYQQYELLVPDFLVWAGKCMSKSRSVSLERDCRNNINENSHPHHSHCTPESTINEMMNEERGRRPTTDDEEVGGLLLLLTATITTT